MSNKFWGSQHTSDGSDKYLLWKRVIAFLLIATAILIILRDAYNIKNGWMHPEAVVWTAKYLLNDISENIGLSFHPGEITKIFWWIRNIDWQMARIDVPLFQLIDAKFRVWLFQYIPPNPAVSLSWLFTLFLNPLLLFRFLRRHINLGVIGSAAITVFYLASPATVAHTFLNYHPGRTLAIFFILLSFHFCMILNERAAKELNNKSQRNIFILLGTTLVLSLFSDPLVFIVFLLIPLFFPKLISNALSLGGEKTEHGLAKAGIDKGLWSSFLGKIKQRGFKDLVPPGAVSIIGASISFIIANYSYRKFIGYFIKTPAPLEVNMTIQATFPWLFLMALAFQSFVFFIKRFDAAGISKGISNFIKRDIVVGSNRYYLSLVYVIVLAVFFLETFYIFPHLSRLAGYDYKFMQGSETLGGGGSLSAWLLSAKYYMAVIANMYWFIIGGIGIFPYLPLFFNGVSLVINYHSIVLFLLVDISIIVIGLVSYKVSSKNKQVIVALIAVYITMAWITCVHVNSYLPGAFIYGSTFSVVFAVFFGAALVSFKEHKKIYAAFIILILVSSFFTYKHAKELNAGWKGGHYRGNDIDGFYKEQIAYWHDIKDKKVEFDMNICGSISKELNFSIEHRDAFITYGFVQAGIAFNKDNVKAINFAAFCGDNYLRTTNGLFGYEPLNLEKIELTEGQLKTSSSNSSNETSGQAIDGNEGTYWHVKFPKEELVDAFIEIDMGTKRKVKVLRILPRQGHIDQLWDRDNAAWEGSEDGATWDTIIRLNIDRAKVNDEWIGYVLPQDEGRMYRYYRLRMRNSFLSLAEMELFDTGDTSKPTVKKKKHFISYGIPNYNLPAELKKIKLTTEQLKVSSSIGMLSFQKRKQMS